MAIPLGLTLEDSIMHNCMIKSYPDGGREITAAEGAFFRERGWEVSDDYWLAEQRRKAAYRRQLLEDTHEVLGEGEALGAAQGEPKPENIERAKRRARTMIRDYARSNGFRYFVTLTFDAHKVTNRYDIASCIKDVTRWLDNRCRRNGLQYILVPEEHKDGAIHFHGFMNDALRFVDSGTMSFDGGKPRKPRSARQRAEWAQKGAHVVYNIPAWGYGFTTAIELYGERDKAIAYVCKYIGKSEKKLGGRWYYSGGGLALPSVSYSDVDFEAFAAAHEASRFTVDSLGVDMVRFFERGCDDEVSV